MKKLVLYISLSFVLFAGDILSPKGQVYDLSFDATQANNMQKTLVEVARIAREIEPIVGYYPRLVQVTKCDALPDAQTPGCNIGSLWNANTIKCETATVSYTTPTLTAMASCNSQQTWCTNGSFCSGFSSMASGYVWWGGGKTLVLQSLSCSTGCDGSYASFKYINCNAYPQYCEINDASGAFCGAGKIYYGGTCQSYINVIPAGYISTYGSSFGRASGYSMCKSQSCIVQQGYSSEGIPFTYCLNGASLSSISCASGVPTLVNGVATCKNTTIIQSDGICPENYTLSGGKCVGVKYLCPTGGAKCVEKAEGYVCEIAWCNTDAEAMLGATDQSICKDIGCDTINPYNKYCGKSSCPQGFNVYKGQDGKCHQDVCPVDAVEKPDGKCEALRCPSGTTQALDGSCK